MDFLTIGQLRAAIADLPDDARVFHLNLDSGNFFTAFDARKNDDGTALLID